jgi:hypothetical protein
LRASSNGQAFEFSASARNDMVASATDMGFSENARKLETERRAVKHQNGLIGK